MYNYVTQQIIYKERLIYIHKQSFVWHHNGHS